MARKVYGFIPVTEEILRDAGAWPERRVPDAEEWRERWRSIQFGTWGVSAVWSPFMDQVAPWERWDRMGWPKFDPWPWTRRAVDFWQELITRIQSAYETLRHGVPPYEDEW